MSRVASPMASTAAAATAVHRGPRPPRGWKSWLLLGFCFSLGYGITHRLVAIRVETDWGGRQRFEVKPFPGTELDSLRRRVGDASMEIRGDLDLLELERQRQRDAAAIEQRRSAMEERERRQQEQDNAREAEAEPVPAADPAVDLPPLPEPPSLPPAPEPETLAPASPPAAPAAGPTSTP